MKPIGMKLYTSTPGTVTATTSMTFVQLDCLVSLDPPGVSANLEEVEPCLSDTVIVEQPTTPKYKQVVATMKLITGDSNEYDDQHDICVAGTKQWYAIQYPMNGTTTNDVYCSFAGYVGEVTQLETDRNNDMKYTLTIAPQTDLVWSTTAPTV